MPALLPDFFIIALGALIGSRIAEASWRHIDGLSYYVLYPALLFSAASSRPIALESLLTIGLFACLIVTVGFLLSLCVSRLSKESSSQTRGGISQNAWRFNTALGFVAVAALPAEATGVMAITVGLAIPLANVYAVLTMARNQGRSVYKLAREVTLNPFLLASAAGVMAGLVGNPLPDLLMSGVDRLAQAAVPIVLLSLGAALAQATLWPPDGHALSVNVIKLIALPFLVWLAITLSGQTGLVPASLLLFAALPTASAAHVLAGRYGADRKKVAVAVMQSTAAGLLTLPFWTLVALRILIE